MKCIVPLAGPDLWTEAHGFRPLYAVDGQPILEAALQPRAWRDRLSGDDYIFVVRDVANLDELTNYLRVTWPGCRIVILSHGTGGALYSVLAAMAFVGPDESLIVDLADILFSEGPDDPQALFEQEQQGAIVPVFSSNESCYSYLEITDGRVVCAREKQVISDHASAGVYMFRSPQVFLEAAAHSMTYRQALSHKGILFICPMVNGVIAAGHSVMAPSISHYRPVGKVFHSADGNTPSSR